MTDEYNPAKDFAGSLEVGYEAIRERVATGGPGWIVKPPDVRVLMGDCRAMLRTLPADSVQCCVTSPPYWGLRDYGVDGQLGLEPSLGEHIETMVDVMREVRRVLRPDGTLWLNYGDCYATQPNGRSAADTKAAGNDDRTFRDKPFPTVGAIFDSSRRNVVDNKHPNAPPIPGRIRPGGYLKPKDLCMVPNRIAIALQEDGWWVRSEIIWGKVNPMPDSSGRYRPGTAHEKIWLLSKSAKSFYDPNAVRMGAAESQIGRLRDDVIGGKSWRERGQHSNGGRFIDPPENRLLRNYEPAELAVWPMATEPCPDAHFATFPTELARRCILAGSRPGDMILDPFGGSGTVGLVAHHLGRSATLIELNPEYAELARNRINGPLFGQHYAASAT
jgi:DNA modification methylase